MIALVPYSNYIYTNWTSIDNPLTQLCLQEKYKIYTLFVGVCFVSKKCENSNIFSPSEELSTHKDKWWKPKHQVEFWEK